MFGISATNCELKTGMLFGEVREVNLGRERPRDPTWGTWILLQKWRCEPPTLGVLVPAPDPQCLCKHVACTRGTLANVPQQWISSSKPCLFCSARSSPRASRLERSLEVCLGQSPIPRHLLLPSSEIPQSCFISQTPSFPIHEGLSPQPLSSLPQGYPDTPACAGSSRPSVIPRTLPRLHLPFFLSCWGCSLPGSQESHLANVYLSPN